MLRRILVRSQSSDEFSDKMSEKIGICRRSGYAIHIALAVSLIMAMNSSAATAGDNPPCPNDGYIPDQMVPTKQVAESVYRRDS